MVSGLFGGGYVPGKGCGSKGRHLVCKEKAPGFSPWCLRASQDRWQDEVKLPEVKQGGGGAVA